MNDKFANYETFSDSCSCEDVCITEQDLCPVRRGDTVTFDFKFEQDNCTPIDIEGMIVEFIATREGEAIPDLVKRLLFSGGSNPGEGVVIPEPVPSDPSFSGFVFPDVPVLKAGKRGEAQRLLHEPPPEPPKSREKGDGKIKGDERIMRPEVSVPEIPPHVHECETSYKDGIGYMTLTTVDTLKLHAGSIYGYKFRLIVKHTAGCGRPASIDDEFTIGIGRFEAIS